MEKESEQRCLGEVDAGNEPNPPGVRDVDRIASNRRRADPGCERKGGGGYDIVEGLGREEFFRVATAEPSRTMPAKGLLIKRLSRA